MGTLIIHWHISCLEKVCTSNVISASDTCDSLGSSSLRVCWLHAMSSGVNFPVGRFSVITGNGKVVACESSHMTIIQRLPDMFTGLSQPTVPAGKQAV
jgi:hypothetical protein